MVCYQRGLTRVVLLDFRMIFKKLLYVFTWAFKVVNMTIPKKKLFISSFKGCLLSLIWPIYIFC